MILVSHFLSGSAKIIKKIFLIDLMFASCTNTSGHTFAMPYSLNFYAEGYDSPHPKKACSKYDTELDLMVRLEFWRSGECGITSSLTLLPGPLLPGVVRHVDVPSMDQIRLFKDYSHSNEPSVKKLRNFTRNVNINIQWMRFPNLLA